MQQAADDDERQSLRSIDSRHRVHACFLNRTPYVVEIVWVNYTGQFVRYQLLRPRSFIEVDTFQTHPWLVRNAHTKDRFHLNSELVYLPKRNHREREEMNLVQPVFPREWRNHIGITLPVYTLRQRTIMYIRDFFKDTQHIDQLTLPKHLLRELKTAIHARNVKLNEEVVTISSGRN